MITNNFIYFSKIFSLLVFCVTTNFLLGQSAEGTDFWFGFLEHRDSDINTKVVMITANTNTTGTVSMPSGEFSENFSVAANAVTIIELPAVTEVQGSEFIQDLGIHLTAAAPVTVYIHQYFSKRSEATLVLPTEVLGKEYYVMSYSGIDFNDESYRSEFMVVATEDNTTVQMTLSDATKEGMPAGSTVDDLVLQRGQVYQIQGHKGTSDLTGTHIISDKPVAVLAGSEWSEVPLGCSARDNLLEMMFPVETWGQSFIAQPFAGSDVNRIRILAAEDNTLVTVSGSSNYPDLTLNRGEYSEIAASVPLFISGDKPITVANYITGFSCSGADNGDPSMVLLNSNEQTRDTVTVYNSAFEDIEENYINIVMLTDDIPLVTLDGVPIENLGTPEIIAGNPEFSYLSVPVTAGSHTIISEGCGIIATCYGLGFAESYAYAGGASYSPINAVPIPDGSCLNEEINFSAELPPERYSVFWDLGDGTESTEHEFRHIYPGLGTYSVELIIVDECLNESDTVRKDLQVTLRQAVEVLPNVEVCTGEEFTLEATDVADATYAWTGPNGYTSDFQYPVISFPTPENAGTYEVIGTVFGCASFPAQTEVTVFALPEPDLGEDILFCPDEEAVTLSVGFFADYTWNSGFAGREMIVDSAGTYSVTVTDDNGCTENDSINVRAVCPMEVYVPNAFSPNFDGINDYFTAEGLNIINVKMAVYDRWGNLVFAGEGERPIWDGRYGDEPAQEGVYVYVIEAEGLNTFGTRINQLLKGNVTLLY